MSIMSSALISKDIAGEADLPIRKTIIHRDRRIEFPNGEVQAETKDADNDVFVYNVLNISTFGCRLEPKDTAAIYEFANKIFDLKVVSDGYLVYEGKAKVVNESRSNGKASLGVCFIDNTVDIDKIGMIFNTDGKDSGLSSIKNIIQISKDILPEFKVLVADLNTLLKEIKNKLGIEEAKLAKYFETNPINKASYEEQLLDLALSMYRKEIDSIFEKFSQFYETLDFDSLEYHKVYFRTNFLEDIFSTPFLKRSYEKPLGYAGDFGLMIMMYDYQNYGASLFHKFLHRWGCYLPAAIANKNRVILIGEILLEEMELAENTFKAASIACGPAKEFEAFVNKAKGDKPVELICIDQEPLALDYAINNLKKTTLNKKNIKTKFFKEDAVLGIIKRKEFTKSFEQSNVITCAGLFDYLSDRVSSKLIESLYDFLAPGGLLLIGNVSDRNPDKFSMDFLVEWRLILRSKNDLVNLIPKSIKETKGVEYEVVSEALDLNLFLKIRKPKDD